jgi:capsular exopolysaccharide synthesis family protein
MDSKDRPEPNVPAIPLRASTPRPALIESALFSNPAAAEPTASINILKAALRAVTRHWWQILLLWAIGTGGACYLIYYKIKPMYESMTLLRVEPSRHTLFEAQQGESFGPYLETQVQLITSPNVLMTALTDAQIAGLSILRDSPDREAELRKQMKVGVVPGSYLVRVSMTSPSAAESAVVVNAVVNAYLATAQEWTYGMTKQQIKNLETYQRELQTQAEQKEEEWLALAGKMNLDIQTDGGSLAGQVGGQGLPLANPNRVTLDQYKRVHEELFRTNIELGQADALLTMREAELPKQQNDDQQLMRVDHIVQQDPAVVALAQQLSAAQHKHERVSRLARNQSDPSVSAARKEMDSLYQKYDRLFQAKRESVQAQLEALGTDAAPGGVQAARDRVAALRSAKKTYEKMISEIEVTNRQEGTDAVKQSLVREGRMSIKQMQDKVIQRLEDLRFASKEDARINNISGPARAAGIPASDNRTKLMAITPIVLLALLTGLFVMLEVKIGRVCDLDDLSKQLPVEVFAVPMLPAPRLEPGQRGAREREGRLQEFLQSLDHLRVALCGEDSVAGTGRCMVISSATGAEGKTTLSAQLAACCAKAGVSTLVIDADMRRATLSRMLNEEKTPGLSDVLQGDLPPDEAYVAVPDAGFHLLPAGTPGRDPSWLLKGQRIGQLITRYRQSFDLILIDTPPILPVPDALTVGRWTDGMVLAARFDFSRLPLVHRARRRITTAGIPLLKTVVNGVRTSRFIYIYGSYYNGYSSDYGGYGYGYGAYGYSDRNHAAAGSPPDSSSQSV